MAFERSFPELLPTGPSHLRYNDILDVHSFEQYPSKPYHVARTTDLVPRDASWELRNFVESLNPLDRGSASYRAEILEELIEHPLARERIGYAHDQIKRAKVLFTFKPNDYTIRAFDDKLRSVYQLFNDFKEKSDAYLEEVMRKRMPVREYYRTIQSQPREGKVERTSLRADKNYTVYYNDLFDFFYFLPLLSRLPEAFDGPYFSSTGLYAAQSYARSIKHDPDFDFLKKEAHAFPSQIFSFSFQIPVEKDESSRLHLANENITSVFAGDESFILTEIESSYVRSFANKYIDKLNKDLEYILSSLFNFLSYPYSKDNKEYRDYNDPITPITVEIQNLERRILYYREELKRRDFHPTTLEEQRIRDSIIDEYEGMIKDTEKEKRETEQEKQLLEEYRSIFGYDFIKRQQMESHNLFCYILTKREGGQNFKQKNLWGAERVLSPEESSEIHRFLTHIEKIPKYAQLIAALEQRENISSLQIDATYIVNPYNYGYGANKYYPKKEYALTVSFVDKEKQKIPYAHERQINAHNNLNYNYDLEELLSQLVFKRAAAHFAPYERVIRACSTVMNFDEPLQYYLRTAKFFLDYKEKGYPICRPRFLRSKESRATITGAKNPLLLHLSAKENVGNDIYYNETKRVFPISGPNSGGKSMYLKGVAVTQLMAQSGLYVFAEKADLSWVNSIYTHFPDLSTVLAAGRFESEMKHMRYILENADRRSLVLIDEPCRGTAYKEAEEQLEVLFEGFGAIGSVVFMSTHHHGFTDLVERNKDTFPYARNLSVSCKKTKKGMKPTHKIRKGRAQTSHGATIQQEMGFDSASLSQRIQERAEREGFAHLLRK